MKKLFAILLLTGCIAQQVEVNRVTLVSPHGEVVINVEIADEPAEHAQGLMHRESLEDGQGMLFVFEREQPLSFWMKNTVIPLDILYFDSEGNLVSSSTMQPCIGDPCASYPSSGPAQYALEVNAGFASDYGVNGDWKLER